MIKSGHQLINFVCFYQRILGIPTLHPPVVFPSVASPPLPQPPGESLCLQPSVSVWASLSAVFSLLGRQARTQARTPRQVLRCRESPQAFTSVHSRRREENHQRRVLSDDSPPNRHFITRYRWLHHPIARHNGLAMLCASLAC